MKFNKEDFDLIKRCVDLVIDSKIDKNTLMLAYLYEDKCFNDNKYMLSNFEYIKNNFEVDLIKLLKLREKLK